MGLSILSLSLSSLYSHLSGKTVLLKSYFKENVSDVLQNFIVDFSKDMAQKNKINAAVFWAAFWIIKSYQWNGSWCIMEDWPRVREQMLEEIITTHLLISSVAWGHQNISGQQQVQCSSDNRYKVVLSPHNRCNNNNNSCSTVPSSNDSNLFESTFLNRKRILEQSTIIYYK